MRLSTRRPADPPPTDDNAVDLSPVWDELADVADVIAILIDGAPRETQQAIRDHLARTERRS
jgi:hypothetical protein